MTFEFQLSSNCPQRRRVSKHPPHDGKSSEAYTGSRIGNCTVYFNSNLPYVNYTQQTIYRFPLSSHIEQHPVQLLSISTVIGSFSELYNII